MQLLTGLALGPGKGMPRRGREDSTWMRLYKYTGDTVSEGCVGL